MRNQEVHEQAQPRGRGIRSAAESEECKHQQEREVRQKRHRHGHHRFLGRKAVTEPHEDELRDTEEEGVCAEGYRRRGVNKQSDQEAGIETFLRGKPQAGEGNQQPAQPDVQP